MPQTKEFREGLLEEVTLEQGPEGVESNYCLKMNVFLASPWKIALLPGTKIQFYILWKRINKDDYNVERI